MKNALLLTLLFVQAGFCQKITYFTVPTPNSGVGNIVEGPDGAMWFVETSSNKVGRVTTTGEFTEYSVPNPNGYMQNPAAITSLGGKLWVEVMDESPDGLGGPPWVVNVYSLSTEGQFGVGFPEPTIPSGDGGGCCSTLSPDRKRKLLWFSYQLSFAGATTTYIASMSESGDVKIYTVPAEYSGGGDVTVGPDDNIWAASCNGYVLRMTLDGVFTAWPGIVSNSCPTGITTGPDGALWFTDTGAIGRITTSGKMTEFVMPSSAYAYGLGWITSAGGDLWFVYFAESAQTETVGRITTSGVVTLYPKNTAYWLAPGPSNTLWSTNYISNQTGFVHLAR